MGPTQINLSSVSSNFDQGTLGPTEDVTVMAAKSAQKNHIEKSQKRKMLILKKSF